MNEIKLPNFEDLKPGAWATPPGVSQENIALLSLTSVVGQVNGPVYPDDAFRCAVMVKTPRLFRSFLPRLQAMYWEKAIGREVYPKYFPIMPATGRAFKPEEPTPYDPDWLVAYRLVRDSDSVQKTKHGLWLATDEFPRLTGEEWIDYRAEAIISVVLRMGNPFPFKKSKG